MGGKLLFVSDVVLPIEILSSYRVSLKRAHHQLICP